jgi:colicin import membrane protein
MPAPLDAQRDALMPPPGGASGRGFALAVVVHLGLLAALAIGVAWRSSPPAAMEAELWAAVPVAAAPRAVEPPPAPPPPAPRPAPTPAPAPPPQVDAQIAIDKARQERERKEELERQQRLERERQQREQRERERREAEQRQREEQRRAQQERREAERAEAQRQENLRRIQGLAGASGGETATGSALQSAGPSATYAGRIKARIKPNIVFPEAIDGNPVAEVEVRTAPDGTIVGRRLVRSSGVREWDDAVLRAIDRTETLPRDVDGRVPATMVIAFRPRD